MGYRGKTKEQWAARDLRKQSWTLQEIADHLGVSRSSVSVWVRDVEFEPKPRKSPWGGARTRPPNRLQRRKQREIEDLLKEGEERIGRLSEKEFLVAGTALNAGEGAKTEGAVKFANSDPRMILFFCEWFRHFFEPDESRMRLRLYLHHGLDLEAANEYWSTLTDIPESQFVRPYRAVPDPSIRKAKHVYGCPAVSYSSTRAHRAVMGLVEALLSCQSAIPG